MNETYDVVCLGEILIDFLIKENGEKEHNPGGAPLNVCAVINKYGGKSAFIGKVGNDVFGHYLKRFLDKSGIESKGLIIDNFHDTTLAFVKLAQDGERSFTFARDNHADVNLEIEDVNKELIERCKLFHFGSLSLTNDPSRSATLFALRLAKTNNKLVSFDANYREGLWESAEKFKKISCILSDVDFLKVSLEEAKLLTGKDDIVLCGRDLINSVKKIVLITLGDKGSYYVSKKFSGYIEAYKANTIDTTGAGDIYFGSFLFEVVKNNIDIEKEEQLVMALKRASKLASLSTEKKGATSSIPEYKECLDL